MTGIEGLVLPKKNERRFEVLSESYSMHVVFDEMATLFRMTSVTLKR